jgi:hypothetical protein
VISSAAEKNEPGRDGPERMPKLGARFWVLWWVAFVLLTAAFGAAMVVTLMNGWWSPVTGTAVPLVFTFLLFVLVLTPYFTMRRKNIAPRMRAPHRRYMMRFLPAMLVYTVLLTPAITFFQQAEPTGVLAWAVAIAPAIPLMFAIRAIMLYYKEEDDEFARAFATQSHLLATGLMMSIATAYGFLDLFELVPHVQTWAVFPLWALCLWPAQLIVGRRYR